MVKKKKRGFFDDIFDEFESMFDIPLEGGMSGYSIEIRSTPNGMEVHARVYGDTDPQKLREQLENMYPGAKIVIETEEGESGAYIRREEEPEVFSRQEEPQKMNKPSISIAFSGGKPIIIRHDSVEASSTKKEGTKKDTKKGTVRITFKKGRPIIKRIE